MNKNNAMTEEEKITIKKYILNNTKKIIGSVDCVSVEEGDLSCCVLWSCFNLDDEDASYLSKRRKAITQPHDATTQKNRSVNTSERI
jgi:hypothetical protein